MTLGALLTMGNKPDARSSRKCPWAADLENMAKQSARRSSAKTGLIEEDMFTALCTFWTNVPVFRD